MIKELALRWPVVRQIFHGGDGTGVEAMSEHTHALQPKNKGASVARSVCPYCAVGCGQQIFHADNRLISIEGDPASPVSRGRLCPKGSASYELLTHSKRLTKVKYRRAFSKDWEEIELEQAMEMIAERVWESRERTFVESKDGQSLMQTTAIAHLGGATLDNEENYLIKKLFTAGLGMVCISNQARI
jgi:formate dehydrogenase major subunit